MNFLRAFKNGVTSVILRVKLLDNRQSYEKGLTGLTNASAGLIISTICDNESAAASYTQAGGTIQTIAALGTYVAPSASNCRFKEVDSTNHPGVYELQFLNARFAVASARHLLISISGVANLAEFVGLVQINNGLDPEDGVHLGCTALPNAAAAAAGGLLTVGTGSGQINPDGTSGSVPITSNIKKNTALAKFSFYMTDATTHAAKTGLAPVAQRSIDGAAFANCTNTPATELSNGDYFINLSASDLNGNVIMLRFTAAGADDRLIAIITQP